MKDKTKPRFPLDLNDTEYEAFKSACADISIESRGAMRAQNRFLVTQWLHKIGKI